MDKPKLNPVAKKWVAALRSGKIKKTTGRLGREDGSRCCLGVLCDLAEEDGVIQDYNKHDGYLPEKVKVWVGLATNIGEYCIGNTKTGLISDNDFARKSFAEIADIIESQPEGLFL